MICKHRLFTVKEWFVRVDSEWASLLASGYSELCLGAGILLDGIQEAPRSDLHIVDIAFVAEKDGSESEWVQETEVSIALVTERTERPP